MLDGLQRYRVEHESFVNVDGNHVNDRLKVDPYTVGVGEGGGGGGRKDTRTMKSPERRTLPDDIENLFFQFAPFFMLRINFLFKLPPCLNPLQ